MVCHAKEETYKNLWYLDIGCNIHMCRDKSTFSDLDESFCDSVKLSDNSKVSIIGKGKETILTNGNYVQTIFNVFFLFQIWKQICLVFVRLEKRDNEIFIKDGIYKIQDEKLGLIAQVNMTTNWMLPLYLHNTTHSYFFMRLKEEAWLWHFCYEHLNFGGLKTLQQKSVVIGLYQIIVVSQVCEECVVSK